MIFILIGFLNLSHASANDVLFSVPARNISVKLTSKVSLEYQKLTISSHKVIVTNRFRNLTENAFNEDVFVPIGPIRPGDYSIDDFYRKLKNADNPIDFALTVDGKKQKFKLVTAVEEVPDGCDASPHCEVLRSRLEWNQVFPPNKTIEIKYSYLLLAGSDNWQRTKFKEFCPDGAFYKSFAKNYNASRALDEKYGEEGYTDRILLYGITLNVEYSFKSDIYPAKQFELEVDKEKNDNLVSFCWPGKIEKISSRASMFQANNYIPKQDLNIVFVNTFPNSEKRKQGNRWRRPRQ